MNASVLLVTGRMRQLKNVMILMNAASSQESVKVVNVLTQWEVISASAPGDMSHLWMAPAV